MEYKQSQIKRIKESKPRKKSQQTQDIITSPVKKGDRIRLDGNYPNYPNGVFGTVIRKGHSGTWVVKLDVFSKNMEVNEQHLKLEDGETVYEPKETRNTPSAKTITIKGNGIKITGTKEMLLELVACISSENTPKEPSNALKEFASNIKAQLE